MYVHITNFLNYMIVNFDDNVKISIYYYDNYNGEIERSISEYRNK